MQNASYNIDYERCKIVAEIGCNHMGDIDIALDMIRSAKRAGADYVKFQKRNPYEAVPQKWHNRPHPCPMNAFGQTYLEHRQTLEFSFSQHRSLKDFCDDNEIGYACSVWDIESARQIISLNPDFIKIPSACNIRYDLLDYVYNNFPGQVHISFGMISRNERKGLIEYLQSPDSLTGDFEGKWARTVPYWTTSEYPVPFERLYLMEIPRLLAEFPRVGFSGHHNGIAADVAAYTLGASWIERHFTLDRTWKGTDQAASLEPGGLQKLIRDINAVCKALTEKDLDLTDAEFENRDKLKVLDGFKTPASLNV